MSNILQGHTSAKVPLKSEFSKVSGDALKPDIDIRENQSVSNGCKSEFNCGKNDKTQVGGLIEQIVSSVNANGKAKIKIEIEISTD